MWIIKTFGNVYLQEHHCCRDLNHQKRSLIFRIRIKNVTKCKSWLKKIVQSGLKLKRGTSTQKGHSALLEGQLAQMQATAQGHLDWDKTHPFQFLEIRMHPSSYSDHLANFSNILISINRGCISKFSTLFHALWLPSFWFFSSFISSLMLKTI